MNQLDILKTIEDKLDCEGFESNPFFSLSFWRELIVKFGDSTNFVFYSKGVASNAYFLLTRKSFFVYSSFLPSQAQISLSTFTKLDVSLIKDLFSFLPVCLKIDLLCIDSKYLPLEKVLWKYFDTKEHAVTTSIVLDGEFDEYWNGRSKNLKKNIKRYYSRIEELPEPMTLRVIEDEVNLKAAIDRYGLLESSGWKAREGTALHPENKQGGFYTDFLMNYAKVGKAIVYELYFGDNLVASRICVASSDILIVLKTTFDESKKNYAVGRILLHKLLEREFSLKRVERIEFYTNATKEQVSWATDSRTIYHISLYRNMFIQRSYNLLKRFKRIIIKSDKVSSLADDHEE